MMGVFTPVWASWRIVFTMAGVAGGMYELVNSGWVPVVLKYVMKTGGKVLKGSPPEFF